MVFVSVWCSQECHTTPPISRHTGCYVRSVVRSSVCLSVRAVLYFYFIHFSSIFFSLARVWIARVCTNVMFDFHLASGDIVSIASVIDVVVAVFVASLTCANCFFGEAARAREKKVVEPAKQTEN